MSNSLRLGRLCAHGLAVLLVMTLVSGLAAATVQGRLDYTNKTPAGGLAVFLTATNGAHPASFSAYSGRNGMYYFSHIPAGTYNVEVRRNNVRVGFLTNVVVVEPIKNVPVIEVP